MVVQGVVVQGVVVQGVVVEGVVGQGVVVQGVVVQGFAVQPGLPPWPVITQPMRDVSRNMLVMVEASSSLSCSGGEAGAHIDPILSTGHTHTHSTFACTV